MMISASLGSDRERELSHITAPRTMWSLIGERKVVLEKDVPDEESLEALAANDQAPCNKVETPPD